MIPSLPSAVYVIGTMDTKAAELRYAADVVRDCGCRVVLVDVGTGCEACEGADVTRESVANCHPDSSAAVLGLTHRGAAVTAMGEALARFLRMEWEAGKVAGALGLGGTGGTALLSPAFQALPVGVPKVLVSTVASGNTAPYVGVSDIMLANSVVDVAGLNRISTRVIGNAAAAVCGMARRSANAERRGEKRAVGMTMFGVTTACVNAIRAALEEDQWECLVFHATGTGGRAMESLAADGTFNGLLDLTTTEVADEVVGGVFPAGPTRFTVLSKCALPCVMSVGALDMVNFGAPDTVPERFRGRLLYRHNAQVTLMRTTADENREFARWMAPRLNCSAGPFALLLPEDGISALDAPGQPFHDLEADAALFEELERLVKTKKDRTLLRLPHHINDRAFAEAVLEQFAAVRRKA